MNKDLPQLPGNNLVGVISNHSEPTNIEWKIYYNYDSELLLKASANYKGTMARNNENHIAVSQYSLKLKGEGKLAQLNI